jgi:hypothetical protein
MRPQRAAVESVDDLHIQSFIKAEGSSTLSTALLLRLKEEKHETTENDSSLIFLSRQIYAVFNRRLQLEHIFAIVEL